MKRVEQAGYSVVQRGLAAGSIVLSALALAGSIKFSRDLPVDEAVSGAAVALQDEPEASVTRPLAPHYDQTELAALPDSRMVKVKPGQGFDKLVIKVNPRIDDRFRAHAPQLLAARHYLKRETAEHYGRAIPHPGDRLEVPQIPGLQAPQPSIQISGRSVAR